MLPAGTQPISMEKTSYLYDLKTGQIGHMCPGNSTFFTYPRFFLKNINLWRTPEDKKIANMLIEEHIGTQLYKYIFDLQAIKRSYVFCDLPGQEYR